MLSANAPGFYFFSNDPGNEAAGKRFLSAPVPAFDSSRAYEADEVYSETSGTTSNLFRALRDTGPAGTPVGGDWERIPVDTFEVSTAYAQNAIALAGNRLYRAVTNVGAGSDLNNPAQWEQIGTLANQYVTSADSVTLKPTLFNVDLRSASLSAATLRLFRSGETVVAWEKQYEAESGNLETAQLVLTGLVPGSYRIGGTRWIACCCARVGV